MIEFEALVLGPAMGAFARPVTYMPLKSAPSAPAFAARGVWAIKPADIILEDGGTVGTDQLTLGVRISEFPYPPMKGDKVVIPAHLSLPAIGTCEVEDDGNDGQGGYNLVLRVIGP